MKTITQNIKNKQFNKIVYIFLFSSTATYIKVFVHTKSPTQWY
jgi:hypothetical protein